MPSPGKCKRGYPRTRSARSEPESVMADPRDKGYNAGIRQRSKGVAMKQYFSLLPPVIFAVLLFAGCENLVTDLPETDVNQYISGNTVAFPKGTKAIDVYNTVASLYNDNEYHDVTNGNWKYIKTTNANGLINQTWESVIFTKIKHTHTNREAAINTHTVYLYSSDTSVKEIIFEWQRQTTNVWKNDAIEGDITFNF
jgi:hypothetical protein